MGLGVKFVVRYHGGANGSIVLPDLFRVDPPPFQLYLLSELVHIRTIDEPSFFADVDLSPV